jgi:hypothetical protein
MKIYQSRIEMIKDLIKESFVCGEFGVLLGDFSSEILSLNPQKLFLIDAWGNNIISGDHNGNNIKEYPKGNDLLEFVRHKFHKNNNVEIYRSLSTDFLVNYHGENFDFIYIDTTHDYQNTLKELEMAFKKTNKRGYISGHDFGVNVAKCDNYDFCNSFGVRDAVNEFCGKYNLSINFLALDGCLSFGIQKN